MSAPCKTSYSLEVLKLSSQPFIESSKHCTALEALSGSL